MQYPNNDLPLLPPSNFYWDDLNNYKSLPEARAKLAELKGKMFMIQNPNILINTLILEEAKESSSIENIFTSSEKLYQAFSNPNGLIDNDTKEVLFYRKALWEAWQVLKEKDWSIEIIEKIFQIVKNSDEGIRDDKVFIGNSKEIVYFPPFGRDVIINKLNNWIEFANSDVKIDPIIKMAVLHYQFEAIHPFMDGNGRSGRIINVLYLAKQGLIDVPVIYLSKYINSNKSEYYRLLNDVTKNENWIDWINYLVKGVEETSIQTMDKIEKINHLFKETLSEVRTKLPNLYSFELVELLFYQPYIKIQFLVDSGIGTRNTSSKYLQQLFEIGVLSKKIFGRETIYLNIRLLEILS